MNVRENGSTETVVKKRKRKSDVITAVGVDRHLISSLYGGLQRNKALQRLAELEVPFPAQLPDIQPEDQFPVDVTLLGANQIRSVLSFWTAQYARVNALHGLAKGRRAVLDRRVDREKLITFNVIAPSQKSKTYVDAVKGQVAANRRIAKLERMLDEAIEVEEALSALAKDFNTYVQILTSEITYRMSEMKQQRG